MIWILPWNEDSFSLGMLWYLTGVLIFLIICVSLIFLKTQKLKIRTGQDEMIGLRGEILSLKTPRSGQLRVFGEIWAFECCEDLKESDTVVVESVHGLKLKVKKKG